MKIAKKIITFFTIPAILFTTPALPNDLEGMDFYADKYAGTVASCAIAQANRNTLYTFLVAREMYENSPDPRARADADRAIEHWAPVYDRSLAQCINEVTGRNVCTHE
jgi:hypothetical protein